MKSLFDSFRPPLWPAYVSGAVILASVIFLLVVRAAEWRSEERAAEHQAHAASVDRIVLELTNAESAQRGFLLTQQERYLERFSSSAIALRSELQQLQRAAPGQAAALDRLDQLSRRKLAELNATIAYARAGDLRAAKTLVLSGHGKALMDQTWAVSRTLRRAEVEAARREEAQVRVLQTVFLAIAALVLLSSFVGVLLLARAALARQRYAINILKTVLDASSDPISLRDRGGAFLHANAAAHALISDAPVAGRSVDELLPASEADKIRQADRAVLERQEPVQLEMDLTTQDGAVRRFAIHKGPLRNLAGQTVGVLSIGRDVTEIHQHQTLQNLMVDELNHRVKNTLATIQSIATQTFRGVDRARYDQFESRLIALSGAHDLLTRSAWQGANLLDVIKRTLGPIGDGRLQIDGPHAQLSPKVALALSLALHELGVNAVKYGAWSAPDGQGQVSLNWSIDGQASPPWLSMAWKEMGGPAVCVPGTRGFGSRLIERGLAVELGGSAQLTFASDGLLCQIVLPLKPAASPLVLGLPIATFA